MCLCFYLSGYPTRLVAVMILVCWVLIINAGGFSSESETFKN